jgi:hypothetical protein
LPRAQSGHEHWTLETTLRTIQVAILHTC